MISNIVSPESYLTPKAGVFEANGERLVRSVADIPAGELVAVFGGILISSSELYSLTEEERQMTMQVDDNIFSFSKAKSDSDYINHSCEPNLGFVDRFSLVSIVDIEKNRELTFDYAMTDSTSFDEFICLCGAIDCRGRVTGNDWKSPNLQNKYGNWFSPYLKLRISEED